MLCGLGTAKTACAHSVAHLKPQLRRTHAQARPCFVPLCDTPPRTCRCEASAKNAGTSGPSSAMDDPVTQAAVEANVDLVGEMISEVCNRMVVESAAAYVTSAEMTVTAQNTIRDAVRSRLDRFDQITLSVLDSLMASNKVSEDPATRELLLSVRAEIVKQVGGTLPQELQALNDLAAIEDQQGRRAILQAKDVASLDATGRAAEQLISEMEDAEAIPDVKLLARLVVVYEEIYAAMDEVKSGASREHRTRREGVPQNIAAFVSMLLKVGDPMMRRAQIFTALKAGCQKSSGKVKGSEDVIRPGAYMQTLYILRTEMYDGEDVAADTRATQLQMRNIVMDSMFVLDDISRGK